MHSILAIIGLIIFLAFESVAAPSVREIVITVSNVREAEQFYISALDFEKVSERELSGPEFERRTGLFPAKARVSELRLGSESIALRQFITPERTPLPLNTRSNDVTFQHIAIVVSDMKRGYDRLVQAGVRQISPRPQRLPDWNRAASGIEAFYFRDPDGHVLELISFPEGKGQARWHQSHDELFLGIDHTAIVVTNTARSRQFYETKFGLRVSGESENYGPEQEYLNGIKGAHLRITGLRGDSGPGIELLEYIFPKTPARVFSESLPANDLLRWETTIAGKGLSEGVFDPDGHALLLVP